MENNFEEYKNLVNRVSVAASAYLDMEGGAFLLAWTGELIRNLATAGCLQSARLTIQKMCESVGVDWAWTGYDELEPVEKQAWMNLFTDALMDCVMTVAE